jgi:hypothetical protein
MGRDLMGRIVNGASCPWGELSMGRNDCGASCCGASFDGASCPWGEFRGGELSGNLYSYILKWKTFCQGKKGYRIEFDKMLLKVCKM